MAALAGNRLVPLLGVLMLAVLAAARASLELAVVRSPIRAQVLEIHAYPGERVGPEGIMELGRTDRM